MKTSIVVSKGSIEVLISGITVTIHPEALTEGLLTLKSFYQTVIPEKLKAQMGDCGVDTFFTKFEQALPFVKRLLACYKVDAGATSTITIYEDGTIGMFSTEQSASFNMKSFMELASDWTDFVEGMDNKKPEPKYGDLFINCDGDYDKVTPWNLGLVMDLDPDQITAFLNAKFGGDYSAHINLNRTEIQAIDDEFTKWQLSIDGNNQVHVLHEPEVSMEEEYNNRSTDQSMESMADNKIEFNSRPTNNNVYLAIKSKTGHPESWREFANNFSKHHGIILHPYSLASTSTCINACDIYGLKAINRFNDPEWNALRDKINRF